MLPENLIIGERALEALTDCLDKANYSTCMVLVDENTRAHCYPLLKPHLPAHQVLEITSGELYKNLETCVQIWDTLTSNRLDRHAVLINLGGGVIGDMGGFCAATYKRGIDFIQVPTTLLAQVDASVGGKLGVDFQNLKNHIGVFQQPAHVVIWPEFLHTLPDNELRSGYAEVIKHALIQDEQHWDELLAASYPDLIWPDVISHSIAIKAKVVRSDPREKGPRKMLNFGHTVGHAIESYLLAHDRQVLHGEAIAAGMICEADISRSHTGLPEKAYEKIAGYIENLYGKLSLASSEMDAITQLTLQDKKNEKGEIRCSLLNKVGHCLVDVPVNKTDIYNALQRYIN